MAEKYYCEKCDASIEYNVLFCDQCANESKCEDCGVLLVNDESDEGEINQDEIYEVTLYEWRFCNTCAADKIADIQSDFELNLETIFETALGNSEDAATCRLFLMSEHSQWRDIKLRGKEACYDLTKTHSSIQSAADYILKTDNFKNLISEEGLGEWDTIESDSHEMLEKIMTAHGLCFIDDYLKS